MIPKKKKIGLIVGSGDLAAFCMEQILLLGYEITVLRLPCSKLKLKKKYHHYLVSARKFMKKRGILSVALGRFAGPLRCTVPFIAGSLGMKSKLFFPIEVLASPVWASIYVLTGYFLGVIFVEYFTYTLIAIILIASFYTAYKDPLKTRK